jgi:hypothetical protein
MLKYNLSTFKEVEENMNSLQLSQETIDIITKLAKLVGAPTYVKTPNFKTKNYKNKRQKTDWGMIRNFKVTVIEKKIEGIEAEMDILREFLNKIAEKTYKENTIKIKEKIKKIRKDSNNMMIICKYIFEIASSNFFYSELYASLYKELINEFEEMQELCFKNFNNFNILFQNIEYINPDEDYEKFCDLNEKNAKRRAMSQFFINLMKKEVLSKELMTNFILSLLKNMLEKIKEEEKQKICEEICENLFILLNNNLLYFKNDEILKILKNITNMKKETTPSLTNKIKFKIMDILES